MIVEDSFSELAYELALGEFLAESSDHISKHSLHSGLDPLTVFVERSGPPSILMSA